MLAISVHDDVPPVEGAIVDEGGDAYDEALASVRDARRLRASRVRAVTGLPVDAVCPDRPRGVDEVAV